MTSAQSEKTGVSPISAERLQAPTGGTKGWVIDAVLNRFPWAYFTRRLLAAIPICIGVSLAAFLMMQMIPGDPAQIMLGEHSADPVHLEQMRERLGLNRPLAVQYGMFVWRALHGDFGNSLRTNSPILKDLIQHVPATVELAMGGMFFAVVFGMTSGILSGFSRSKSVDTISMLLALIGVSMPIFWLGLQLISWFPELPSSGRQDITLARVETITGLLTVDALLAGRFDAFMSALRHLILPSVALGLIMSAMIARMTRSNVRDVLSQTYIQAARARGVSGIRLFHHTFRNALIPVITVIGLQLGTLLSGAVITESIFAWPGLGTYLVHSIFNRDYPAVQSTILIVAIFFVLVNILVDVICAMVDPRVRASVESN